MSKKYAFRTDQKILYITKKLVEIINIISEIQNSMVG